VELEWPEDGWRRQIDSYRTDFRKGCNGLMQALLPKDAPAAMRDRIGQETCANDAQAAIALLSTLRSYPWGTALREAGVPVWAINGTGFPTALEINRKYAPSFEAILMEGVGHYPQVERPAAFQEHLRRVIRALGPGR
jgi:pimeloyl-ACP methyl ester carboxylesterase